jgi:hypothetical protein
MGQVGRAGKNWTLVTMGVGMWSCKFEVVCVGSIVVGGVLHSATTGAHPVPTDIGTSWQSQPRQV